MNRVHVNLWRLLLPVTYIATALRDIAAAIEVIERSTIGMDCDDFRGDPKAISAVECNLALIGEAAVRLGSTAETWCPGPSWRDFRGIGNWLSKTHEWNWLTAVWKTVCVDLPPLKAAVHRSLDTSVAGTLPG
jgi:uncharacterized protein with HEPN domain